jgi:uncharacterized protein YndB with AHSA1/START domain
MTNADASRDAVMLEREFDAPVEFLWQMWTVPAHFEAWYGPSGASVSVVEMDVRVGGRRLVSMGVETPMGARQMWFVGEYLEVIDQSRLVYTDAMADEHGSILSAEQIGMPSDHPTTTEVRVEFHASGDRTKMMMTHVGVPADSPGAAGWSMAFDKLAAIITER